MYSEPYPRQRQATPAAAERYLSLIKKSLANELYPELEAILHYMRLSRIGGAEPDATVIRDIERHRPDLLAHIRAARADGAMILWPRPDGPDYDPRNISEHVHTMIGRKRLDHLHACLDDILRDDIEGT